jgi:hypothetical protein
VLPGRSLSQNSDGARMQPCPIQALGGIIVALVMRAIDRGREANLAGTRLLLRFRSHDPRFPQNTAHQLQKRAVSAAYAVFPYFCTSQPQHCAKVVMRALKVRFSHW